MKKNSNLRFIIDGQIFVNCMVGFNNKFNDRTKLWCMINVFSANATFEVCEVLKMRYGYRNLITVNIIGNRIELFEIIGGNRRMIKFDKRTRGNDTLQGCVSFSNTCVDLYLCKTHVRVSVFFLTNPCHVFLISIFTTRFFISFLGFANIMIVILEAVVKLMK